MDAVWFWYGIHPYARRGLTGLTMWANRGRLSRKRGTMRRSLKMGPRFRGDDTPGRTGRRLGMGLRFRGDDRCEA